MELHTPVWVSEYGSASGLAVKGVEVRDGKAVNGTEGQGCTYVEGLRFHGHNNYALGVPRPTVQIPMQWEPTPVRKDAPKRGWTPGGWVQ
jgi:hypothetical protein